MLDEQQLALAFERILATRMSGMPLLNGALQVEVSAFRDWQQRRVGVLITPWAVNLVVLPGSGAPLEPLALNERRHWDFPSGRYEFMGGEERECGAFDFCPLFSPPEEFAHQDDARAMAEALMRQLFEAQSAPAGEAVRMTRRSLLTLAGA